MHVVKFLVLLVALVTFSARGEDASIFPDKNLERAVRKFVFEKRDNDKPIVEADVANLSTIEAHGAGITNLAGLEKCISLASLDLASNKISDLSALRPLKGVQYLVLKNNQVGDIAPLGEMKSLQYVDLSHNKVKTIDALASCTNMHSVYVSQNEITDLSPAFKLSRLSTLYADNNKIKSIAGINQLKFLTSLSLNDNELTDLQPLVGLTHLSSFLFLERNKIRELMPLVEMARADTNHNSAPFLKVYLKGNPLSGTSKSGNIKELKTIGMRINR